MGIPRSGRNEEAVVRGEGKHSSPASRSSTEREAVSTRRSADHNPFCPARRSGDGKSAAPVRDGNSETAASLTTERHVHDPRLHCRNGDLHSRLGWRQAISLPSLLPLRCPIRVRMRYASWEWGGRRILKHPNGEYRGSLRLRDGSCAAERDLDPSLDAVDVGVNPDQLMMRRWLAFPLAGVACTSHRPPFRHAVGSQASPGVERGAGASWIAANGGKTIYLYAWREGTLHGCAQARVVIAIRVVELADPNSRPSFGDGQPRRYERQQGKHENGSSGWRSESNSSHRGPAILG